MRRGGFAPRGFKLTPIWDDLGCGGIPGEGVGSRLPKLPKLVTAGINLRAHGDGDSSQYAVSHVMAEIGKAKKLPLINAGGTGGG